MKDRIIHWLVIPIVSVLVWMQFSTHFAKINISWVPLNSHIPHVNSLKNNTHLDLRSFLRSHNGEFPVIMERDVDTHRENAAFMVLCRNEDLYSLTETIQNVQDRFNSKFSYDWVFLNDVEFTEDFMYNVLTLIPSGSVKFGKIPQEEWSIPDWINQTLARENWDIYEQQNMIYGKSESYRNMCRYFSGFFYNHPLMATYQYYWRIEPGVKYYCDIDYDVFQFMQQNEISYGFTISMFEYADTIPSLWSSFNEFMDVNDYERGDLIDFVQNDDKDKTYNLCHFWTNFEIADLRIFQNSKYQQFFQYLDQLGGFYYERWGDAPVHSLFISSFLNADEVWWFGDIGYYHAPYLQCPRDTSVRSKGKCSCNPEKDFSSDRLSCTNLLLAIKNMTTAS
ncbi:alpha-1,2 mannosyltransferase Ktr1p [[Candida] railenensis]|uniref:Alpha-1,2 mannosyltransferase Ktr1p n=1 Tax=[Candida] railenensis TaxID=45579 RepID=A0A9P0QPD9_9ASCO|nr:alpha-1,2 mannosyltransferase Ktr1p [[Candida] railenensis]